MTEELKSQAAIAGLMPNLSVAVIGPVDFAKDLGKKGTSSDITLYDVKRGEDTVSFIEATMYPERLAPLYYTCAIADMALLVVDQINAQFGESLLMLDVLQRHRGLILLRNFLTKEQLAPMIKGTVAENYAYVDGDLVKLREWLLDEAGKATAPAPSSAGGSVPIDHCFNVKGVGTVVLGLVARGEIRKHDTLKALPGKKETLVRSVQKHEDDFEMAVSGDRVGLSLKGVDSDELDRGFVLTNQSDMRCDLMIKGKAELIRFWPTPLKEGMVVHLGHWMQFIPARVVGVENGADWRRPMLELSLEKEVVHPPGARGVLMHMEGGKLRIVGTVELA
ncbi:MAG: EF-Tu/IF-2/RF-3 family GTPase [Methanomassiliicoccales archaeon]|nr:EF-Tu/IF-2/RF-3 family GTPase [Methanomassiliicoccales archaeon]